MNYYSGGPDEFILALPKSKQEYFLNLLTTNSSLGMAMDILDIPYQKSGKKIVEIIDGKILTNANTEEEVFYKDTLFTYKHIANQKPQLVFSAQKLFNFKNILNTFRIIISQAKWVANIDQIISKFQNKISDFRKNEAKDFEKDFFPYLIAIGYLNEYFSSLTVQNKTQEEILHINVMIDDKKIITDRQLITVRKLRAIRSEAQKLIFKKYI